METAVKGICSAFIAVRISFSAGLWKQERYDILFDGNGGGNWNCREFCFYKNMAAK